MAAPAYEEAPGRTLYHQQEEQIVHPPTPMSSTSWTASAGAMWTA